MNRDKQRTTVTSENIDHMRKRVWRTAPDWSSRLMMFNLLDEMARQRSVAGRNNEQYDVDATLLDGVHGILQDWRVSVDEQLDEMEEMFHKEAEQGLPDSVSMRKSSLFLKSDEGKDKLFLDISVDGPSYVDFSTHRDEWVEYMSNFGPSPHYREVADTLTIRVRKYGTDHVFSTYAGEISHAG